MRRVTRPAVDLPTLREDGPGGRAGKRHRVIRARDPGEDLVFAGYWNLPDVRGALYAMQGWVCAYCQCDIPHRDGGDVDHFRPKNGSADAGHEGYWWLAYRFDNYLLSCRRCNEHIKKEHFPVRGSPRATEDHADPEAHEIRLLTDPTRDPVEEWFRVDMSDPRCAMKAPVAADADPSMRWRTEETVRFFHLSVEPDLIRPRVRARSEVVRTRDSKGSWEEARERAIRYQGDSMAWRDALLAFAPDVLLPTPDEELRWLLGKLLERLDLALELIAGGHDLDFWKQRKEQIFWTLAVLWEQPPTNRPEDVARWLSEHKLTPWVEPLKARLTRAG